MGEDEEAEQEFPRMLLGWPQMLPCMISEQPIHQDDSLRLRNSGQDLFWKHPAPSSKSTCLFHDNENCCKHLQNCSLGQVCRIVD